MLSFPPQNDKNNFFFNRPGVLEKTDPGDGKPTYFKSGLSKLVIYAFNFRYSPASRAFPKA